jgi:hypothetical protein
MAALFEPEELQGLAELIKLGRDYGPAIMSTSGTGASNSFRDIGAQVLRGFRDEKALDAMKSRARGKAQAGLLGDGGGAGLLKADDAIPPRVSGIELDLSQFKRMKRGKVEKRLKGAQSVAPSQYDED